GGLTCFAMAVAGVFRTAEREMHLGSDRSRVDVRDSGLQVAHRPEGLVDVAREDGRGESVPDPVRDANRFVEVLDADQCRRGAEDLLLGDPHLRVDLAEDRRAIEVPLLEPVTGRHLAAREELRTFALADLRVRVDL